MLALYGAHSPVGINLFGTRTGMFVALLFVTLPFTVRTVQPVLLDLDRDAEQAAASLGAGPAVFRRIVLPQILPAMASGAALAFARALGEYGSLLLHLQRTAVQDRVALRCMIYSRLQDADNVGHAAGAAIATVLLLASALVLICWTSCSGGRPAVADVASRPRLRRGATPASRARRRLAAYRRGRLLVLVPLGRGAPAHLPARAGSQFFDASAPTDGHARVPGDAIVAGIGRR